MYTFTAFWLPVEMQILSSIVLQAFRICSSDLLRNKLIRRTSRRRWGRVFRSWRREGRTEDFVGEVSDCSAVPRKMARLMWNPRITVMGSPAYCQNGPPSKSVVLCLWLREVYGKCGLGANAVVDPERLDLRLLLNFAPMTRGMRWAFSWLPQSTPWTTHIYLHIGLEISSLWGPLSEGKLEEG